MFFSHNRENSAPYFKLLDTLNIDNIFKLKISLLACFADKLNPRIVRLRISDQKLVPPPRVFYNRFQLALAYGCPFGAP